MSDATTERRANELYWNSSRSVNQIADDLDVSKSAFYGMISAQPSGRGCPACGAEAAFANRTARDRGMVACPDCAWEGPLSEALDEVRSEAVARVDDDREMAAMAEELADARGHAFDTRRIVMGSALLGAAAVGLIIYWTRRR